MTAAWAEGSTSAAMDRPLFVIWMVMILLVSVPITLGLLIRMFMPELAEAPSRTLMEELWNSFS